MKDSKEYELAKFDAFLNNTIDVRCCTFDAGYDFAMSQPKHIFDGAAQVGEIRRFEDGLVDVVVRDGTCNKCVCNNFAGLLHCNYLIGCKTNNVKYIKR